ncbi:histone-lysine N-methyltransferase, H3 lysine-79 specific-like isoform X25 [Lates calcarifer]|uniref:Histone-lysine N-methyltransferase, H3 lysine-79 specific-like isoform X14 n=1 Tax=Lates calcarifer TaxID=8187 RepID=A0AAJ8B8W1_LATCA|nr:histone-lysine N-methyltransferase, H3 lysine-79 specific-like isoform X12 [Lates calcarifer]XP_050927331.1 histone-lysine N-methyltransferase, H3 lysine-79 specific-like isoform X13 [Lates calcarifer]XP_050927342.1 histone-lysine N-methyltransferase, H3 lysine-79 specific-like isoform X14 [Lates calcarifer]XP_050927361.1 histone-lysine N-methyltransferase, H3 lysine-79 specific-like isoform X15 [Lates calcarifer]XP_050927375.1 histone-lysine N-methyltransferase, H3 lysine-79 specific-like i
MGNFIRRCLGYDVDQTEATKSAQTHQEEEEEILLQDRSALNQKEEELKSLKDRMTEMERLNQEKLHEARSALKQKEEELKSVRISMTEMETFYKEKLQEARSALKQKEEELKSFRDRMATELAVSVTGDTKNIPVSKTPAEIKTFYEEKLHEARSALKRKDEELKSVKNSKRLKNEEGVKSSFRRCEQHECEHKESMTEMETFYKEKLQEARSALKQKEEELKSFRDRMATELAVSVTGDTKNIPVSKTPAEIKTFYEEKLHEARSALKRKDEELKSVKNSKRLKNEEGVKSSFRRCEQHECEHKESMTEMETFYKEKLQEARSALKQKEEELKSFRDRMATELAVSVTGDTKNIPVSKTPAEIKTFYEEKLHEARSALKQKDEELKSVKDRLRNEETMKPSCRRCEQHEREHKERMTEMETFYKEKLQEARSALKQKEEEVKSFKDRVAPDLALSIKTGDTESMNNPVSKTKLTEMYNKLKLLQWPKIKDHLKSNAVNREFTRDLTQKMFRDAAEEMERKKKQIDEVFGLIENSSGLTPQKVKEFRQLTIHSLQMNLYHSRKEDLLQSPFLDDEAQYSQDVMVNFRLLASECYWLGCLMALNNPPLQPDWENHSPGLDTWDIFPRSLFRSQ